MSGPSILVIGGKGQVATALAYLGVRNGHDLTAIGRPALDLTDAASIARAIDTHSPDIVINAAAYTDVDGAESAREAAFALNANGVATLCDATQSRGIALIHLSTDCVFDGTLGRAYTEGDETHPLGVYGASKLAGEQAVAGRAMVVRVTWIFSHWAGNFVKTMLRAAETRSDLRVVNDQFGCPTHAEDLAAGLIDISGQVAAGTAPATGLFHLAGQGETDRAGMARAIFDDSAACGGPVASVTGVATRDYRTPATRPLNARLDSALAQQTFGVALPHWRARLRDSVRDILGGR